MSTKITYNSQCLMKDGKAWFPVMGEMHYSRYREELWEESLYKMKAGGVDVVSTYVIWLHHEEEKGVFDFEGCRNLRKYLELCQKVGLKVLLRLGPWVHGECRNGGFPDWVVDLAEEGVALRTNDERYLAYVRRYWSRVAEQAAGLVDKDGGPVIGIQLENEYGHVGGLRGEAGDAHMRTLMAIAKELGLEASFYTATGWGGAVIGDALPVMGGYCDAPWDRSVKELPPNSNYIISHVRNDALIACDHHVEDATAFDEKKYPYLTAELGGGLQVTSHRRPVATGADIGAMSLTKLASGVALLGYYMYHGGSNPEGKFTTLQECRTTKIINYNDLPEINYDFNAPIRQYGTISDNYREIKLLALFLQDFGEDCAVLPAEIDPENVKPGDMHTLRKSCRHDDTHGYVFFNNYQRRHEMDAHKDVVFEGITKQGKVTFPKTDLPSGAYGFFPYNMQLGDAVLSTALATPLCRLKASGGTAGEDCYVFYGDFEPEYSWKDGKKADILHLSRQQALNAWKVTLERDYLIINDNYVWEQDGELKIVGDSDTRILTYPALAKLPEGFEKTGTQGRLTVYERHLGLEPATASAEKISEDAEGAVYEISVRYGEKHGTDSLSARLAGRDTFLYLSYEGYSMDIFMDGKKINDHFYTGQQVPLSLGYFGFPEKLTVKIKALHEGEAVYIEKWPELKDGRACGLTGVSVAEEIR